MSENKKTLKEKNLEKASGGILIEAIGAGLGAAALLKSHKTQKKVDQLENHVKALETDKNSSAVQTPTDQSAKK